VNINDGHYIVYYVQQNIVTPFTNQLVLVQI